MFGWMPNEPNFLPKARRPLATIAYFARAMALYVHGLHHKFAKPQGYDAILVMVERFAKLAHMVSIVETAATLETS
jgi:hypothetical protein